MNKKNSFIWLIIAFFMCLAATAGSVVFYSYCTIPDSIMLMESGKAYKTQLPVFVSLCDNKADESVCVISSSDSYVSLEPVSTGSIEISYRLFGFLKMKKTIVNVIEKQNVYLGGDAIGISLRSEGLIVTRLQSFHSIDNVNCCPASDAGIKSGDTILYYDNIPAGTSKEFGDYVKSGRGRTIEIEYRRDGKIFRSIISPSYSDEDEGYKLGMWISDGATGIGTITYITKTGLYGALGHGITTDNKQLYTVSEGTVGSAYITQAVSGCPGTPGQLVGRFADEYSLLGDIQTNTQAGIFGKMHDDSYSSSHQSIEVGLAYEVEEGTAQIAATLDGTEIELFDINIVSVNDKPSICSKALYFEVTSEDLINRTGGIVQGMSGSPIIQNGKLIGAVTQVLVQDPSKGYGILAETMLSYDKKIS